MPCSLGLVRSRALQQVDRAHVVLWSEPLQYGWTVQEEEKLEAIGYSQSTVGRDWWKDWWKD